MLIFISTTILSGKSYSIEEVDIQSTIMKNGVVTISETRKWKFEGKFSWVQQTIVKSGFDMIYDIQFSEFNNPYENRNNEALHTFQIIDGSNRLHIKWFHNSEDEEKVFTLSYKLKGAIKVGPEDSQFHWTYLGDAWDKKSKRVNVKQSFETGLPEQRVWYSISGKKCDSYYDRGNIMLNAVSVSKNKSIRLNTIFPTDYFDIPVINSPEFSLKGLLEKKEKARYGLYAACLTVVSGLIFLLVLYNRFGKPYKITDIALDDKKNFPSVHHPAVVSYLYSGVGISGSAILATLFRLAGQGHFVIKEEVIKTRFFKRKKKKIKIEPSQGPTGKTMEEWDTLLSGFISEQLNKGVYFLDKIFEKINKSPSFKKNWSTSVDNTVKQNNWIEKISFSENRRYYLLFLGLIIIMFIHVSYNIVASIIAIIVIAGMALGSLLIKRLTYDAESLKQHWIAFKKNIESGGSLEDYNELDTNQLLYYLITLGLGNNELKNIEKTFSEGYNEFVWFYPVHSGSGFHVEHFSSMIETCTTVSAGYGGDGGFSGGGGGGGAGGGGGGSAG